MLGWATPAKNVFFGEKKIDLFGLFLDLLDLKNGSGSKFYTRKWYSEVWKRKIKLFYGKTIRAAPRQLLLFSTPRRASHVFIVSAPRSAVPKKPPRHRAAPRQEHLCYYLNESFQMCRENIF